MSKPDGCTCGWVDRGPATHHVWIMARWDDACPHHGANTEWRKQVQDHARKLSDEIKVANGRRPDNVDPVVPVDNPSAAERMLAVGDRIEARPCVVTIAKVTRWDAYGRMPAPVVRLCLQQHDAIARMRRTLDQQQQVNEVLSRQLAQARRDLTIVALMAKDKDAAMAFLDAAHDIDSLEETA